MSHRVLVVDDEENIRSLVKDYLEGQGFRVYVAGDGDDGIQALRKCQPHLVVIDFLLPRKNGFAVAEALRGAPQGQNTPIVMMSGVFKNPKTAVEAREKYQVLDFLSKPLDMEHLTRLVADALHGVDPGPPLEDAEAPTQAQQPKVSPGHPPPRGLTYGPGTNQVPGTNHGPETALHQDMVEAEIRDGIYYGRPFPQLSEEGKIDQFPVAYLLSTIRYNGGTGMLDMTDHGTHRRIYIIRGHPTFMQSNAEGENVGALLLRRGRITEPDFARCQRDMKEKGRTLQQSLLELRLVSENDLATAYKLLAGQLLPLAIGMAGGTYRWRKSDAFVGRVPEGKFEPVAVLLDGIKRHVHPPQILKFFRGREDLPVVKTTEFDKLMPFFRRTFSANNIAQEVDGEATYRSISRNHADEVATVVPQLFALVTSGMAVIPRKSAKGLEIGAIPLTRAASEITGDDDSLELAFDDGSSNGKLHPDDERARRKIQGFYDQVMSQDFFQIFHADRDTGLEKIKAMYFDLTKRWHVDAFAGRSLGSAAHTLDEVFQRITEAYETITDKQKKGEYMAYLDRKAKGLPTDAKEMLRGEQLYDQAQAMITRNDWRGAKPVLDEAISLNPDPLYFATLGWVMFNLDQGSQSHVTEAVHLLKQAIEEQEDLSLAYQYLGQICFVRGDHAQARNWWKRCLEREPNNIEATRGLRTIEQQAGQQGQRQSGLLSRFMTNDKKR